MMAIELIRDLGRRGIRLRSLSEPFLDVDTSTLGLSTRSGSSVTV